MGALDPYLLWLGIREPQRPPNHYLLLGIALFEARPEVINQAAERQMARVRQFEYGPNVATSQYILGEIAAARVCLLTDQRKIAYDAWLRRELGLPAEPVPAPIVAAAATSAPQRVVPVAVVREVVPVTDARKERAESALQSWVITLATFMLLVFIGAAVLMASRERNRVEVAQPAETSTSWIREVDPREVRPSASGVAKAEQPDIPSAVSSSTIIAGPSVTSKPQPARPPGSALSTALGKLPVAAEPPKASAAATPAKETPSVSPVVVPTTSAPPAASPARPALATSTALPDASPVPTSTVTRAAVPDEAARKKALTAIRNDLKTEYTRADKPEGRGALASLLLKRASEASHDLAWQYVVLCEARDQAVEGGDAELFLQALAALAERFAIDDIRMKAEALAEVVRRPRVSGVAANLAKVAMDAVYEAMRVDKYTEAEQLLVTAKELARRAKDSVRLKEAMAFSRELESMKRYYAVAQEAYKTLATRPDDAAANLTVGRYLCLIRGDWTGARSYVQKSGDVALRQLLAGEGDSPGAAAQMVVLADQWWDASAAAGSDFQRAYRSRAVFWYRQALPALSGSNSARATRRLAEFGDPSAQRP